MRDHAFYLCRRRKDVDEDVPRGAAEEEAEPLVLLLCAARSIVQQPVG